MDIPYTIYKFFNSHIRQSRKFIKTIESFPSKIKGVASHDLAKMGLIIVSFSIKDVRDKNGDHESLGKLEKWFCLKVKPKLIGASAWSGNQRLNCTKSRQTRFSSNLPTV